MKRFQFHTPSMQLADFDIGGIMYHGNYFRLFEQVREAFLGECGSPYPSLVADNLHLAVTDSELKFLMPIRYGVQTDVHLHTSKVKSSTANFHYEIFQENNLCHLARTKHVLVRINAGLFKPERFPTALKTTLLDFSSEES